jgi:hypothetical protein
MRARSTFGFAPLAAAAVALALGAAGAALAQGRLVTDGGEGRSGRSVLSGGFMPDPWTLRLSSGGAVDAGALGLGRGCAGFVSAQPDYILDYEDARGFLRFYFEAAGDADSTLVVRDPSGAWRCNDDSHGGLHPTVDVRRPPSGAYRIWIGSARAGARVSGTLHVTELRSRHP